MSNPERELVIGGMDYIVQLVDGDIVMADGEKVLGYCDYTEQKIIVNRQLKADIGRVTILHEIVHAILEEAGQVELNNEDTVDYLAHALHSFIKYNLPFIDELYDQYYQEEETEEAKQQQPIGFKI